MPINYDKNIRKCSRCPRVPGYFDTCAEALLFPPSHEARASSYAGKIGTGDEAKAAAIPRGGADSYYPVFEPHAPRPQVAMFKGHASLQTTKAHLY